MKTSSSSSAVVIHALNNLTVTRFVEDTTTFEKCSNECFGKLDVDGQGGLSREKLRAGFGRLLPGIGYVSQPKDEINVLHDAIFERFDADKNGVIDGQEFQTLLAETMLAVARGIGGSPVLVALEHGSLLMRAAEHEKISENRDQIHATQDKEEEGSLDGRSGLCWECAKQHATQERPFAFKICLKHITTLLGWAPH